MSVDDAAYGGSRAGRGKDTVQIPARLTPARRAATAGLPMACASRPNHQVQVRRDDQANRTPRTMSATSQHRDRARDAAVGVTDDDDGRRGRPEPGDQGALQRTVYCSSNMVLYAAVGSRYRGSCPASV